jgi:hypothetical protein
MHQLARSIREAKKALVTMAHKECQDPARKKRNGKLILHECLSLKHSERDNDFSEFLVDRKGTSRFNLTFGRSRSTSRRHSSGYDACVKGFSSQSPDWANKA